MTENYMNTEGNQYQQNYDDQGYNYQENQVPFGQYQQNNQQNNSDWRGGIAPELQGIVQKYGDLDSFVKAHRELQSLIGRKVNDFSQTDWQAYANIREQNFGIPQSPYNYQIDPRPTEEGMQSLLSAEETEIAKEIAYGMGLDNDQAQALHDTFNTVANEIYENFQAQADEKFTSCCEEMAASWGNSYGTKLQQADYALGNVLPQMTGESSEKIREELLNAGAANSPVMLKTLAAIGEMFSESTQGGFNNLAPMDAQQRMNALLGDPDRSRALSDRTHPLHEQVRQELSVLSKALNGGY